MPTKPEAKDQAYYQALEQKTIEADAEATAREGERNADKTRIVVPLSEAQKQQG